MNYTHWMMAVATLLLSACGAPNSEVPAIGKAEGPDIKSLSHEQVIALYQECTRYGRIDDPKVKYTVPYCAAIQSAQLSAGYAAPGTATVDPTITKMH